MFEKRHKSVSCPQALTLIHLNWSCNRITRLMYGYRLRKKRTNTSLKDLTLFFLFFFFFLKFQTWKYTNHQFSNHGLQPTVDSISSCTHEYLSFLDTQPSRPPVLALQAYTPFRSVWKKFSVCDGLVVSSGFLPDVQLVHVERRLQPLLTMSLFH